MAKKAASFAVGDRRGTVDNERRVLGPGDALVLARARTPAAMSACFFLSGYEI
jgi:hypothetical protein